MNDSSEQLSTDVAHLQMLPEEEPSWSETHLQKCNVATICCRLLTSGPSDFPE